ncbi:MAG: hypothetical protein M1308_08550 [Actinobacteria bacterium]|nr:hypothetical protein [Actinomycetota bacterium]
MEENKHVGKLKGQIEQWDLEVTKLQCDYKDAAEKDKEKCLKKIKDLQIKISDAADKIEKMTIKSNLKTDFC